jgi:hypothetical protein
MIGAVETLIHVNPERGGRSHRYRRDPMKLYVCYGTWTPAPRPGGHPCGAAYHALVDAGHRPEVVRSYGLGMLPDALQITSGRREVKNLTGNYWVPTLVLDDGEVVDGRKAIVEWAHAHPASAAAAAPAT